MQGLSMFATVFVALLAHARAVQVSGSSVGLALINNETDSSSLTGSTRQGRFTDEIPPPPRMRSERPPPRPPLSPPVPAHRPRPGPPRPSARYPDPTPRPASRYPPPRSGSGYDDDYRGPTPTPTPVDDSLWPVAVWSFNPPPPAKFLLDYSDAPARASAAAGATVGGLLSCICLLLCYCGVPSAIGACIACCVSKASRRERGSNYGPGGRFVPSAFDGVASVPSPTPHAPMGAPGMYGGGGERGGWSVDQTQSPPYNPPAGGGYPSVPPQGGGYGMGGGAGTVPAPYPSATGPPGPIGVSGSSDGQRGGRWGVESAPPAGGAPVPQVARPAYEHEMSPVGGMKVAAGE